MSDPCQCEALTAYAEQLELRFGHLIGHLLKELALPRSRNLSRTDMVDLILDGLRDVGLEWQQGNTEAA